MKKVDLIKKIAVGADISQLEAEQVLNSIIFRVIDAVKAGDEVQLIGFGSFVQARRTARLGRNPVTGQTINIPESLVIRFRPGKAFKFALNQGE